MGKIINTLTVGSGGREHAIMDAFQQEGVNQYATQANAGMELLGENLKLKKLEDIVDAASAHDINFVTVGPEAPLIAGLADRLRERRVSVLGFNAAAAMLEGSKAFAADFTDEFGIDTPDSYIARSKSEAADYVKTHSAEQYVIKADGQAGGKGVILPETDKQAKRVTNAMMSGELFGDEGKTIVFQERLTGPEVSMFAIFDGKKAVVLPLAQDHKRLLDGDKGPNTGGMGAYSPVSSDVVDEKQSAKMLEALDITMLGMQRRYISSPGILYLGFILAEQRGGDPALLEYNVRLGDPEAQVVLPLLKESGVNVHELFYDAAHGRLKGDRIKMIEQKAGRAAVTVCLAAAGYPETSRKKDVIYGIDGRYPDVTVYHGATIRKPRKDRQVFTRGGRIAYPTGFGETVEQAAEQTYNAIGEAGLYFKGMQYRKDIGRTVHTAR